MRTLQTAIAATLLAVVGCCVPAVAGAVNWEEIASYPDARAYVDMDSVSRESNIGSIWLKLSYLAEQEFTTGTYRSNWMHTYFRCQDKLWAVKGGVLFSGPNLDGERIYETKVSDADLDWKVVDNGSFAEDAMNLACQTRASAGNDSVERLSIQAVAPDGPTRMLMGDHWSIYLDGEIDPDAAARLEQILAQKNIEDADVYLNSPGGSLSAAVDLGRVFREHGFSTNVGRRSSELYREDSGVCYSACPFAYAGGVWRFLDKGSQLGVHRFYSEEQTPDDLAVGQVVSAQLAEYLQEMDVGTELFSLMSLIPSDDIRVLTLAETLHTNLVNNGRAVPQWSIETFKSGFYLRGAQDTAYGPGRLALLCQNGGAVLMAVYDVSNSEEIVKMATHASIRVDDELVPATGGEIWLDKDNDTAVGSSNVDAATLERMKRAKSIGFAFQYQNSEIFHGFAVEVGDSGKKVRGFLEGCGKRE